MTELTQLEFLQSAKDTLDVTWDALAEEAGIKPRALKTYRMPPSSKDYRTMPSLARSAISRLMQDQKKKQKKNA